MIRSIFKAAQKEIPLCEYIGSQRCGEYLVLDAYRRIIGRVTLETDGTPKVHVYKLPASLLPN